MIVECMCGIFSLSFSSVAASTVNCQSCAKFAVSLQYYYMHSLLEACKGEEGMQAKLNPQTKYYTKNLLIDIYF